MIAVTPKTVTTSDSIVGFTVRGTFASGPTWSPASLQSISVRFLNAKRQPIARALEPSQILPTLAQMTAIQAVPRKPADTAETWLERASAPFVAAAYGLSVVSPSPTPSPSPHALRR